mgnify:FL=1
MKLKEIVNSYKAFGEAKVNSLEESEILKIVKARKAMRSIVEDFEAFLKDVQEKFKPENLEELQIKAQKWSELSDEEKMEINKIFRQYEQAINTALLEEQEKEFELNIDKLSEESVSKLLKDNEWSINKLDEISIMV